jgi:lantibiotic modifying enzyme
MWDTAPSYLEAAEAAARWIRSAARETEHGLVWLPEPDHPERRATVTAPATLYSGSAGIVIFLLELARATGDAAYLDDARRGADQFAATWREALDVAPLVPLENAHLDFGMGLAGTAFTLAHAWRATREERYRRAALAITGQIVDAARPAGGGVTWTGSPTVGLGDGSIVLYLLWAARAFDAASLLELARRAGERMLELGEWDPRGGLRWAGPSLEGFGMPAGASLPNFELGTAGVAFTLARLHAETGEPHFLVAAREGAAHVRALATVRGDAALLFYREPDLTDLYYLGYCHGPVGTARLFYELHRITAEGEYLEGMGRFARGIMGSGIPEKQAPGLWNVVCQCCGTAGIADFFVSLWVATGQPEYLAFARRVADQTLSRATDLDGKGYRWYQAWTRTQPWAVTAETGYMIGAAGVGAALLHLHLAERGRYEAILFPDNPFPQRAGMPEQGSQEPTPAR